MLVQTIRVLALGKVQKIHRKEEITIRIQIQSLIIGFKYLNNRLKRKFTKNQR